MTANKNETSGAFLNSTSQSFYNRFSDKEFSTLLCLRYNLDLDFIPTNLQCTCKIKNKITGKMQPKFIDKTGFRIQYEKKHGKGSKNSSSYILF